jgi:hypothetical protein
VSLSKSCTAVALEVISTSQKLHRRWAAFPACLLQQSAAGLEKLAVQLHSCWCCMQSYF